MSTGHHDIEFALFAPYNEHVALIGDWNDWEPIAMTRGDDGWWRVGVPLDDGDYQYRFQVKSKSHFAEGEMLTIADPRSLVISDDEHENTHITVKDGKRVTTRYQWQHDEAALPPNEELVFYELHVQDFSGGPGDNQDGPKGRFEDVVAKLDYLAELGITAVELMPVNEFPGGAGWGYNPRYLFAVEKNYGTPDDLCRLVDECHARGIRVVLDGVYNHSEDNTPLAQIDYTYWYYGENPDDANVQWGPKFNYQFHDDELDVWPARQFALDAILHWIEHFHIDGIRFDATAIIDNFDVLNWFQAQIYQHVDGKPFITVAEHVPQDPSVTGLEGPLDAAWHEHYSKQIMATIVGQEQDGRQPFNLDALVGVIDPRRDGFESAQNVVNYIDNHDQDRILWQLGEAGFVDDPAFRRMKLGAGILMTSPGMPLIWMGQEFGESAPKTLERQPIDWALLQNERNEALMQHYRGLIRLRESAPALRADTFDVVHLDAERCIMAYKRWNDEGNVVVVVANLQDQFAGELELPNWPGDGTWHEYVNDYDVEVGGGMLYDTLAESEIKIYVKTG